MNYDKIYNQLISRCGDRKKEPRNSPSYVYYESHHIVPRCMGGSDSCENLVLLTAEEHWVAHLLLCRMYPDEPKLAFACKAMSITGGNSGRTTNRLFGWIRRSVSDALVVMNTGREVTPKTRLKISEALRGIPKPMQRGNGNVSKRPEVAEKIKIAKTGKKTGPRSETTKEKISASKRGRPNLPGERNPAFKGCIIATPLNGAPEIRISSKQEMLKHGFCPSTVYDCVNGKRKTNVYKNHAFVREPKSA